MADPRFFDNKGPFTLAAICMRAGVNLPASANGDLLIADVASLSGAGPQHLSFLNSKKAADAFAQSRAAACFVPEGLQTAAPSGMIAIPAKSVMHAFAQISALFYPAHGLAVWTQSMAIHPSARIAADAQLAPGVVIGPDAEIGEGTKIGPNTVIARGVTIGRHSEIGSNVSISHSYIGDQVMILPGAQIGQPGFGFASGHKGHMHIPQLGRVIVQDNVEIGACATIDRGALGDTTIGEGTKIDNLVQIGHNNRVGRHNMIVSQVGIAGSCELGDFVVLGGQVGLADHVRIGDGVRFAARAGVTPGDYMTGDWGGTPAVPSRQWLRQVTALAMLTKKRKKSDG